MSNEKLDQPADPAAQPVQSLKIIPPDLRLFPLGLLYKQRLEAEVKVADNWLLMQTVLGKDSRHALLRALQIPPGSKVLDAGCGYGALSLELATMLPVDVLGIDMDPEKVAVSNEMLSTAKTGSLLENGSTVQFRQGDVRELEADPASFDVAVMRFVLEYLPNPEQVVASLAEKIKPGGFFCIVEIDDGTSVTYPPHEDFVERLVNAFQTMQSATGVDRYIGRKVPGFLDAAGFDVKHIVLLPQAGYRDSKPEDVDRIFMVERLTNLKSQLVEQGGITSEELEASLQQLKEATAKGVCNFYCNVAVIGQRREQSL